MEKEKEMKKEGEHGRRRWRRWKLGEGGGGSGEGRRGVNLLGNVESFLKVFPLFLIVLLVNFSGHVEVRATKSMKEE